MITAIHSANTFKSVYIIDKDKLPEEQRIKALDIKTKLKNEAENKDFILKKDDESDSLLLSQVTGLKTAKSHPQKGDYIYLTSIKIGRYDNADSFQLTDIQKAYNKKEQQKRDNLFISIALFALTTYLALASAFYVKKVIPAKVINRAKIEMVQKADTLKNDIIKNIK